MCVPACECVCLCICVCTEIQHVKKHPLYIEVLFHAHCHCKVREYFNNFCACYTSLWKQVLYIHSIYVYEFAFDTDTAVYTVFVILIN